MRRFIPLTFVATFSCYSLLLADDGPKFAAKFEANYDKILPYRAEIIRTFKSPEKEVQNTQRIEVLRNKHQFKATFPVSQRTPNDSTFQYFRNGSLWYRSEMTPDYQTYYIGPARTMPGQMSADPMDAGSQLLVQPLLLALTKGKLKSETAAEVILELEPPAKLPTETWTIHLAKAKSCVPTKSVFSRDGKTYLEISIEYRDLPGGAYFPKQIEQTSYSDATGKWTQKILTEVRLMAFGKEAKADTIDPPPIPPGVKPIRYPDAEDEEKKAADDAD